MALIITACQLMVTVVFLAPAMFEVTIITSLTNAFTHRLDYYCEHRIPKVSALLLLNLVFKACFWCAHIIGEASALFRWVFVFLANAIELEC